MTYDTIKIPGALGPTPVVTGELYSPLGTAQTGLVVLAYGTDGYVDNERGPGVR